MAVAEQAQEFPGVASPGDQQNVLDPRIHQRLNGVVDHRLVVHGQQMLVGDPCERIQPAAGSACEHDAFHRCPSALPREHVSSKPQAKLTSRTHKEYRIDGVCPTLNDGAETSVAADIPASRERWGT